MINKINAAIIPSFKGTNQNRKPHTTVNLSYETDTFCKSRSQRNTHTHIKREKHKMNTSKNYCKVNPEFNKNEALKILDKRLKTLPQYMDSICALTGQYINGQMDADTFAARYLDLTVPFYKRIKFGEAKEEYCTNYKPEISMIKKISAVVSDYNLKKTDKLTLDSTTESAVEKYINTPIKRDKIFII